MKVDYIALSIPIFFILIGIELLYGLKKKISLYRMNDSVTNISLGIGQQVTGIFMKTALFYGYLYLFQNFRFTTIETSFLSWLILFTGVDFFYYWFHRLSHEINALWAAHIVHHQSEEYNLSVALRQSWFQNAFSWIFYLPLALIGFDPIMFLTISAFNTLYQFWIHTRTINRLGPLEWVLNTPSHHRVYHGSDPKYLDKNHGGTLIIWDRIFGTFQEETNEPHYGITRPLRSWNPVWANFHYWAELFRVSGATSKISDKILIFLKPPGWMPAELGGFIPPAEFDDRRYPRPNHDAAGTFNIYIVVQFVLVILVTTVILFEQAHLDSLQLVTSASWVILSITSFGAIFENKSWAGIMEYGRLLMLQGGIFLFFSMNHFYYVLAFCIFFVLSSLIWFRYLSTIRE